MVQRSFGRSATVPDRLLPRIRSLSGVAAAAGGLKDQAKIIGANGKAVLTRGPPTFGYGIDFGQPRFSPLGLLSGRWPHAGEVAARKNRRGAGCA